MEYSRNRKVQIGLVAVTIILGLSSRKYGDNLVSWIAEYSGDALWALMMYFIVTTVRNKISIRNCAIFSIGICFIVEFSQLYHAPWIDTLRSNQIFALVLGQGFLWSDLICYTIGVLIGCSVDQLRLFLSRIRH